MNRSKYVLFVLIIAALLLAGCATPAAAPTAAPSTLKPGAGCNHNGYGFLCVPAQRPGQSLLG